MYSYLPPRKERAIIQILLEEEPWNLPWIKCGVFVCLELRVPCSLNVRVDTWLEEKAVVTVFAVVYTVSRAVLATLRVTGHKCLWVLPEPQLHMDSEPWEPGVCCGRSTCARV